jgi:hypothetical protein
VRGSAHPGGLAAAANGGLRRGVLQARRLVDSRASCALTSETVLVLAKRARLRMVVSALVLAIQC